MIEAKDKKKDGDIVNIFGVGVVSSPEKDLLRVIFEKCGERGFDKPFFMVSANPEIIMLAQQDEEYRQILNKAGMVFADGVGLTWAGVKEVVPGRQLVARLLQEKLRVFYLGGRNGVAKAMVNIFGGMWDSGSANIKEEILTRKSQEKVIEIINNYKPDVLLVAYGAPWQEKWIAQNLDKLQTHVVMGVGGTFDYLTGRKPVPPVWVNKIGLEWLWRLVHEPWRWKRQLSLVKFVLKLWTS